MEPDLIDAEEEVKVLGLEELVVEAELVEVERLEAREARVEFGG